MKRGQPLRRTAMKRKPLRRGRMDPEFREAVLRRDGWRCQAAAWGFGVEVRCWGRLHVHHRELGTKIDVMENVITLCETHHDHAHTRARAEAEACGIITPSR